jgi:cell filamentation protein
MHSKRNDYRYLDLDYSYTDPLTGVLRNIANISDRDTLTIVESGFAATRTRELQINPVMVTDSRSLLDIHHYLFQDIYKWAGETRTVEISKGGKQFFPLGRFSMGFAYIDNLLAEYRMIDRSDKQKVSQKLAEILDSVNYLHPFREGNGRTQREFVRVLALEKGYTLNLNPPDDRDVYERYMSGTIDGDVEKLSALIEERLS